MGRNLEDIVKKTKYKLKSNRKREFLYQCPKIGMTLFAGYVVKKSCDFFVPDSYPLKNFLPFTTMFGTYIVYRRLIDETIIKPKGLIRKIKKNMLENNTLKNKLLNLIYDNAYNIGAIIGLETILNSTFNIAINNYQLAKDNPLPFFALAMTASIFTHSAGVLAETQKNLIPPIKNHILIDSLTAGLYSYFNKDKMIKRIYKIISKDDTATTRISLAKAYRNKNEFDKAAENYNKVIELIEAGKYSLFGNSQQTYNVLKETIYYIMKNAQKKLRKNFDDQFSHLEMAICGMILNDTESVKNHVEIACNVDNEHKLDVNVLGGGIYDYIPEEGLAKKQWAKTINLIMKDESIKYESMAESNSEVYRIDPKGRKFLSNFFVFKTNKDREVLEKEKEKTEYLEKLVEDHDEFLTVRPLHISDEIDGKYVYVTRFSDGELLSESIDIEDYKKAASYLGLIHREMGSDGNKSRWMNKNIDKYLTNALPMSIKQNVAENLSVAYDHLEGKNVFDKDAHPFNWIVGIDKRIISIDNEDKGNINQFLDLAKILEYTEIGGKDFTVRKQIIDEYFKEYGSNKLDEVQTERSYLNAVIIRTFACYSFTKEKEITSMKPFHQRTRAQALENGLWAAERLINEHNQSYTPEEIEKYKTLTSIMSQLKSHPEYR